MIEIQIQHLEKIEDLFSKTPKEAPKLISSAINRSASAARTKASTEIRAKYIIKASDIKSDIKIKNSTPGTLSAQIRTSGPVIPLMKFDVTPTIPDIMVVRARVKKGGRKKIIQKGFVASMGSSHTNVFTRVGKSRLPIQGRYGPSIAQMMGEDSVVKNIEERAQDILDKRLVHEFSRLIYGR